MSYGFYCSHFYHRNGMVLNSQGDLQVCVIRSANQVIVYCSCKHSKTK